MSSRPITPAQDLLSTHAHPEQSLLGRPNASSSRPNSYLDSGNPGMAPSSIGVDHAQGAPAHTSILSQSGHVDDTAEMAYRPTSSEVDGSAAPELHRSDSRMSQSQSQLPAKGGTLKKKASLRRTGSMLRSNSRRSSYAGSVKSLNLGEKEKYGAIENANSAFHTPVPTTGNPTELLANRFQAWRKVLKDLITYFRDLQKSYDGRSKALLSTSSLINNTSIPSAFLTNGGLGDAILILRELNKQSVTELQKARDIENEIILQLTGLRSDLQQKIKEIKSLAGDFKSSVDKEQEGTKRAVRALQEALGSVDHDSAASSGKGDPFIVKMSVDRQVERQIEEENYLHRAYLNLESSGRELESIVVGEIQKAYNAYAGILKRDADEQFETAERLRQGPLAIAKDHEWDNFVMHSDQMVDPKIPIRQAAHIAYPGKDHPAAIEVRSGMLERKSKYLKNYTPGWYILSPTHLHEFKSADRIAAQAPIMSLFLPEQKLGSHSEPGSSSHKFMLKGRQTGSMHRGHTWIFRAESHDTMMAWFADIKELTEKKGEQRNEFVRRTHARSLSGNSLKAASIGGSSDGGMEEDEADRQPYSSEQSVRGDSMAAQAGHNAMGAAGAAIIYDQDDGRSEAGWHPPQRPSPGGRFPSDVNMTRGLQAPLSPSSGDSDDNDRAALAAASALPASGVPFTNHIEPVPIHPTHNPAQGEPIPVQTANVPVQTTPTKTPKNDQAGAAVSATSSKAMHPSLLPGFGGFDGGQKHGGDGGHEGEWLATSGAVAGGAVIGAGAVNHFEKQAPRQPEPVVQEMPNTVLPTTVGSTAPMPVTTPIPVPAPLTDSPTTTHAATSFTHDETGSLSTVPTSVDHPHQNQSYVDKNGVWTAAHGNADSVAGQAITLQMSKVEAMGIRPPAVTAQSSTTISDLHIPGEFPNSIA